MRWLKWMILLTMVSVSLSSDILMITMGGTKSHKIPFWELARGLIARNHSITFISGFPADFHMQGLEEITPAGLVFFIRNYTNWDLVGSKLKGEDPVPVPNVIKYAAESCETILDDHETKDFLASDRQFDLIILDGAYPDCAFGFVHHFKAPYIYINTVGFYTYTLAISGSPVPYSTTPFFNKPFTDNMSLSERLVNSAFHIFLKFLYFYITEFHINVSLRKHFGPEIPSVYDFNKNVSFILQNGHYSVSYPRPYMPNVAEIACIHCRPAKPLNMELEDFINQGGDSGFIFVSMGSSVKTSNIPEELRKLFVRTFARLPYQILWKWEDDKEMNDLPHNVLLNKWLPQQDLLGHKKIKAFVTHGGLLSMFESVYHGVPVITMPVFCDHESNAAKAEADGYALKLDLQTLTTEQLLTSINKIIHDKKFKDNVKKRQYLLKDQPETPLQKAIYWVEYVIRHNGASHFLSPARNLNIIQYYSIDTLVLLSIMVLLFVSLLIWLFKSVWRYFLEYARLPRKVKRE